MLLQCYQWNKSGTSILSGIFLNIQTFILTYHPFWSHHDHHLYCTHHVCLHHIYHPLNLHICLLEKKKKLKMEFKSIQSEKKEQPPHCNIIYFTKMVYIQVPKTNCMSIHVYNYTGYVCNIKCGSFHSNAPQMCSPSPSANHSTDGLEVEMGSEW